MATRNNSQSSVNIWDPDFPPKRQKWVNQTSVPQCRCTPSIDTELLPGWAPRMGLDTRPGSHILSILRMQTWHVAPHAEGLTPLLKKKRADPMLTDPNLPQLPLPTATSVSFPPVAFHFNGHLPLTHPPLIWRGNVHLWLYPDITTIASYAFTQTALCDDSTDSTWVQWKGEVWSICAVMLHHFEQTQIHWVCDTQTSVFFFSTMPPFFTWKLGFLLVNPLIHQGKGQVGFWRFDWQGILGSLWWSISLCEMLLTCVLSGEKKSRLI